MAQQAADAARKRMDLETEMLLARLITSGAQQLQERAAEQGVTAFCGRAVKRERPNERFLQNTLKNVYSANRRADETVLWEQRQLQLERERRERQQRRAQQEESMDRRGRLGRSESSSHPFPPDRDRVRDPGTDGDWDRDGNRAVDRRRDRGQDQGGAADARTYQHHHVRDRSRSRDRSTRRGIDSRDPEHGHEADHHSGDRKRHRGPTPDSSNTSADQPGRGKRQVSPAGGREQHHPVRSRQQHYSSSKQSTPPASGGSPAAGHLPGHRLRSGSASPPRSRSRSPDFSSGSSSIDGGSQQSGGSRMEQRRQRSGADSEDQSASGTSSPGSDGGHWVMSEEEVQAMLNKYRSRGRGGVGSRADDTGPFLPEGPEPRLAVSLGPEVPGWLRQQQQQQLLLQPDDTSARLTARQMLAQQPDLRKLLKAHLRQAKAEKKKRKETKSSKKSRKKDKKDRKDRKRAKKDKKEKHKKRKSPGGHT